MRKSCGVSKRILPMLLCTVMVMSLVPVIYTAGAVAVDTKQADLSIME